MNDITISYLNTHYVCGQKSIAQIAKETGRSRTYISNMLDRLGIVKRRSLVEDMTGSVFHQWTVQGPTVQGKCKAKCSCGTIKLVHAQSLRCGKSKKCYRCRGNLKTGSANAKWKGHEQIHGAVWKHIEKSAKKRAIIFEITITDAWEIFERQNQKCALSGLPLVFSQNMNEHRVGGTTASLDRIDSTKGYTKLNVQWIHKTLNRMKSDLSESTFIDLCVLVAKQSKAI